MTSSTRNRPRDEAPPHVALVVDDDADIRDALRLVLEVEGHTVAEAANGARALAWLATHPTPCVVLLDLMMPVLDGWETLRRMRADPALARIPVIVCTAFRDDPRTAALSGVEVLRKPLSAEGLIAAVARHCAH